ncbi:uncharacterized protein A4U43_C03F4440 [Asparagus officinalis]|uniref:Uncharacterized protein n=1 Tax=Asparagus officinalis TaxID=4686 RepID=A0A5P1FCB3_ASPOF|nr:uncharacterized protein A4U43_C03F4440 [Asparagus officinalis]
MYAKMNLVAETDTEEVIDLVHSVTTSYLYLNIISRIREACTFWRWLSSSFVQKLEELLRSPGRPPAHIIRVIEGFETVVFRSKFASWPQTTDIVISEDGRGKVAALLKRQGLNVKGLMKAAPVKEEPQPFIDCTGNL